MKNLFFGFLIVTLATISVVNMSSANRFTDVSADAWFHDDVFSLSDWDVIRGNEDGTFNPTGNVNRAELAAMWNRYDKRVNNLITEAQQQNDEPALSRRRVDTIEAFVQGQNRALNQVATYLYYVIDRLPDHQLPIDISDGDTDRRQKWNLQIDIPKTGKEITLSESNLASLEKRIEALDALTQAQNETLRKIVEVMNERYQPRRSSRENPKLMEIEIPELHKINIE
jgi:hypothetical protein